VCVCVFKKERGTEREGYYLENYLLFWLTVVPESILFVGVSGSNRDLIEESICVCVCERERERKKERKRERERERERERDREKHR
jgi:hypothetical protein